MTVIAHFSCNYGHSLRTQVSGGYIRCRISADSPYEDRRREALYRVLGKLTERSGTIGVHTAASPGVSSVTLSWVVPSSDVGFAVTGYHAYEGTRAGAESTAPVACVYASAAATSCTVAGLADGTTYFSLSRLLTRSARRDPLMRLPPPPRPRQPRRRSAGLARRCSLALMWWAWPTPPRVTAIGLPRPPGR